MKIAVAGFGIEGRTNYEYFKEKFPSAEITIVDERRHIDGVVPVGAATLLGPGAFEQLDGFDMVVRTAGLAPRKIATDGHVWSATNEFFAVCPAPIIGVTGTKGKGTTASLIASILQAAGKTVHLVGNIGVPGLGELKAIQPSDVVVYELSSFQLWDLQQSPHVAVVLMIEPDHLDVHSDMAEYIAAKSQIVAHQGAHDVTIYHPNNTLSAEVAHLSIGKKYRYGISDDGAVYVESNNFCVQGHAICSVDTLHLVGQHNIENACAAITAVRLFDQDVSDQAVANGLAGFDGLPHRLKLVKRVGGISYYDDSIATTPGSAIAALRAFDQPKVIILGGSDKGANYESVVALCRDTSSKVVTMGQTGKQIAELCEKLGVSYREAESMEQAVQLSRQLAEPGGVVILSPAAASFDMFTSYVDRGQQFVAAVERLAEVQ